MHLNGTYVDVTPLIVESLTDARPAQLEYVRLPNGELALLRATHVEPDREPRFALTQRGRDDLRRAEAMDALFGRPWPSVAEASGS